MDKKEKGITIITVENAKIFVYDALKAVGAEDRHAQICAEVIVEGDRRGHFSHGMTIFQRMINDVEKGFCNVNALPEILKQSTSTVWLDGHYGLGPVVAEHCMNLAIQKAKECGFGFVNVKNSSNLGVLGYWGEMALKHDCIGMVFTNCGAAMVPTGTHQPGIGGNAMSFAAPSHEDDSFSLDMSTAIASRGKVQIQWQRRKPLVRGWLYDEQGNFVTDVEEARKRGLLVPLGGYESTSGYKGCGLAEMLDIFTGVLSGGLFGADVKLWTLNMDSPVAPSQTFIAIDISAFAPYFKDRLNHLMLLQRRCEPADPSRPVIVAGDNARAHKVKVDMEDGIRYCQHQINVCQTMAKHLGINYLQCKTTMV